MKISFYHIYAITFEHDFKSKRIISNFLYFSCLLIIFINGFIQAEEIHEFPLDIRNNYVPTFLHLDPQAVSPTVLPKGKSSLSTNISQASDIKEANLYVDNPIPFLYQRPFLVNFYRNRYPQEWQANLAAEYFRFGRLENQFRTSIDLESTFFYLRYNYGITERIELGVQMGVLSYNSGIMDGFINSYHAAIRVKTGKELVPNNEYAYRISDSYGAPLSSPPRTGLGDTVLSAKWNLKSSPENGWSLALVGLVKAPTGLVKYDMGSGRIDGALGLAVKYKYNKWNGYWNLYGVGVSNSLGDSEISLRSFVSTTLTLEYRFLPQWSVLLQIDGKSSAFSSFTPFLSRPPVLISGGLNWKVRKTSVLQFTFTEDITITVPDVTFHIGWKEFL